LPIASYSSDRKQPHKLSALDAVISRLVAEYPGVAVLDTRVVLRSVKSAHTK
jgi:hypothetical protein